MADFLKIAPGKIPTLVGLKFTSRDLAEAGSCLLLKRSNGKDFHFLFGSDEVIYTI
jgi:dihydrodipicolinate synthase/N-acetylneuraminate lyase